VAFDPVALVGHSIRMAFAAPFVSWIKRLNHLTMIGQENVPQRTNTLFVSNHRSFLDPFLVGFAARGYAGIWRYDLSPFSPIAADVVTTPFRKFLIYRMLRCIPVQRGHFNPQTHKLMVEAVRDNTMILFPEGGITPNGKLKPKGRAGVGALIRESGCTVVPVYHNGLERILPVWASRFYWGQDVYCKVGKPVDVSAELEMPNERATWDRIVEKVMDALRDMESEFVETTGRSLDLPQPPQ